MQSGQQFASPINISIDNSLRFFTQLLSERYEV